MPPRNAVSPPRRPVNPSMLYVEITMHALRSASSMGRFWSAVKIYTSSWVALA